MSRMGSYKPWLLESPLLCAFEPECGIPFVSVVFGARKFGPIQGLLARGGSRYKLGIVAEDRI